MALTLRLGGWNEDSRLDLGSGFHFDSVTLMNDTRFGPSWDLEPIYQRFENDTEVISGNEQLPKIKILNEHILRVST